MIRFAAHKPGDTSILGFGLCDENLRRLRDENEPIAFLGETLDIPGAGCDFAIFAGKDWEVLAKRVNPLIEGVFPDTKDDACERRINIINVQDGMFYVVLLPPEPGIDRKMIYAICLTDKGMAHLRAGRRLSFRARHAAEDNGVLSDINVLLFWMESRDKLEAEFIKEGLITGHTKYTKDEKQHYVLTVGHYRSRN